MRVFPLIVLEGLDAAGKATQAKKLAKRLDGKVISFPAYNTPTGRILLDHLKERWKATGMAPGSHRWDTVDSADCPHVGDLDPMVFQCIQTINRYEVLPETTKTDRPVIFDRYYASSMVYGEASGCNRDWLESLQAGLPQPHLWILLDIPVEEGFKRRPERRDRFEAQQDFLHKIRTGYLKLWADRAMDSSAMWHLVDGTGTPDEVHARVWGKVQLLRARVNLPWCVQFLGAVS